MSSQGHDHDHGEGRDHLPLVITAVTKALITAGSDPLRRTSLGTAMMGYHDLHHGRDGGLDGLSPTPTNDHGREERQKHP